MFKIVASPVEARLSAENCYRILNITKDTPSTVVREKYKQLIKRYHPEDGSERNIERFQDVLKAYRFYQSELAIEPEMEPDLKNLYERLRLTRDATLDQIKKAYRTLSKSTHPDTYKGDSLREKNKYQARFQAINEAYVILADDEKRQSYDKTLQPEKKAPSPASASAATASAKKGSSSQASFFKADRNEEKAKSQKPPNLGSFKSKSGLGSISFFDSITKEHVPFDKLSEHITAMIQQNKSSSNQLMRAIASGASLSEIEKILNEHTHLVRSQENGNNPMHLAVVVNRPDIVSLVTLLCSKGASKFDPNRWGMPPLHLAISSQNPSAIDLLNILDAASQTHTVPAFFS